MLDKTLGILSAKEGASNRLLANTKMPEIQM